ncbi:MAG: glycosyltransferase [Runella sp.]
MSLFYQTDWLAYPSFNFLLVLLTTVLGIQLYFILTYFWRIGLHKHQPLTHQLPPVTVVVCAHNELENLHKLLPMLNEQDYPKYEVIVMNDRSWDGTEEFAKTEAKVFDKVRFIHIENEYDHVTPKKYAITTAIRQAKYDVILLTDADCRPLTDQWIKGMAACLTDDKDIVLGFSPYLRLSGLLNLLIRFETFYTAVQYLSMALGGKPYMGVGRNLMYRKNTFLKNKGFYTHLKVVGGDDDLLMNEIATATNTAVCLDPDTFMESYPKTSWSQWLKQKRRHLSVSKYYQKSNKIRLGLLSSSHFLFWVLGITLAVLAILKLPLTWGYLYVVGGMIAIRGIVQWVVLGKATQKLYRQVRWYVIPLGDVLWPIYYFWMGSMMWIKRKKKIRWR